MTSEERIRGGMSISINFREVLIYLGYKGGEIPASIHADIERCADLLTNAAGPRTVWKRFELQRCAAAEGMPGGTAKGGVADAEVAVPGVAVSGTTLAGTTLTLQGQDIRSMLAGCPSVILMAATLGSEVEKLIRKAQVVNMPDAVILDACASSAIESVCNEVCAEIEKSVAPFYLTDRYSPGYGDFPLEQQAQIFRTLDVTRRIGVTLTDSGLMIPQKSVTAVVGVSPVPVTKRPGGCAQCNLFENCQYRKDGTQCDA